jgi:hypothetical protein
MYHGSSSRDLPLHEGLCLAGEEDAALDYALYSAFGPDRYVHEVTADLDGLTVLHLDEGYDRDENIAPADLDPSAFPGADVIVFADETIRGRAHDTYRLLTPAALAAVTVTRAVRAGQ